MAHPPLPPFDVFLHVSLECLAGAAALAGSTAGRSGRTMMADPARRSMKNDALIEGGGRFDEAPFFKFVTKVNFYKLNFAL